MRYPISLWLRLSAALVVCIAAVPSMLAQNSIQLFGPVDIRLSAANTGYGASAVTFNSANINLTCPASPTALLSSTADGTGSLLVDNNINISTTIAGVTSTPANVCTGGFADTVNGSAFQDCFGYYYELVGDDPSNLGVNPDTLLAAGGGVAPINISSFLVPGPLQLTVGLQDEGGILSSSTLYLDTNCTQNGATGPALVTGNPISQTAPTPQQLAQDFNFNPTVNQNIGFTYDLSQAQVAGSLAITDGTIPEVNDSPLDPAVFQPQYVTGTSFATSNCLIHSGELLPSGLPACKLYTLQCKVGTGTSASGALCPVSTLSNEIFKDTFDGPNFTLPDITTPGGQTFHQGVGFLMASEGWTGGPCAFDPASGLQSLPCPQNLLSSFTSNPAPAAAARGGQLAYGRSEGGNGRSIGHGPKANATANTSGSYTSSGRTTHPNSTFISVAQVPEDLTTVTVAGQQPGYWINTSTAVVNFSSQPPNLTGTTVPGAANFVPSPITSITYGISSASAVPTPGVPVSTDTTLTNSIACPTPANPTNPAASVFAPTQQTFPGLADGSYLVHYFAQDCAGTEELKFTQDSNGNWSTGYYTYPINVDTVAPVVANGPALSPAPSAGGSYFVGQTVTASFSCTDERSGVAKCGGQTFAAGTLNTGTLSAPVDTSSAGSKQFTVVAIDAAGNQSSALVNYTVINPYDPQIHFTLPVTTANFGQNVGFVITISPVTAGAVRIRTGGKTLVAGQSGLDRNHDKPGTPTGTVNVLDGSNILQTLRLNENGSARANLIGLNAGPHSISVTYSGDAKNPSGSSAPASFTVLPAPVHIDLDCLGETIHLGRDVFCLAYVSSKTGPATGAITYQLDGGAPTSANLDWGFGFFWIPKPSVGKHTVTVNYAAQGNFLAAPPKAARFNVIQGDY